MSALKAPEFYAIIPARYKSSRFPGKPLADILGKPMFWHVYTRAKKCPLLQDVYLATDDSRIFEAAKKLHVPVLMTSEKHKSGTDRILEAAKQLNLPEDSVIVNVQGDEPALNPEMLTELLKPFTTSSEVQVTTLAKPISFDQAKNPDIVKVVCSSSGHALYFSRSPIPFGRDRQPEYLGHIGLYAMRMNILARFKSLGESRLERWEKLEQLRLLEADIPILVVQTNFECHGVDRPEDIARVCELLAKG